ncbi:MAG: glutathione S-transferase family protein [Betaproteobacteria bacterium]|nr:glutathione S-transferase family protein [Betaproteobacteria bacterium]
MTLKLCGFAASNYYNKIKLQLLHKGVAFEEELVWTGNSHPKLVARSPLGKVPFLETPDGCISESMVLAEYIESKHPEHALLPSDPFQAAKIREIIVYLELHIELVVRLLYPEAFFGGKVSDLSKEQVQKQLSKNIAAFARLAKFSPYIAGDTMTLADCAAAFHLPIAVSACKLALGEDLLVSLPVKAYSQKMAEHPDMPKVLADRKANNELMSSLMAAKK